ncbi:hypothetical protein AB0F11_32495 [Streptomyces sp. NPDC032472]|uniref:hypothetical protein n=1 Tax=Streptomyces sp. NPDC032472 TaxID=3155018 RepID=UPI0033FEE386
MYDPDPDLAPDLAPGLDPDRVVGDRTGALRRLLRRPVAAALLGCGVLHLPGDAPAPASAAWPAPLLPQTAAALCLGLGALLAVRDADGAWRAAAAAAVGVVALHVVGGVTGFAPLQGAVSASLGRAAGVTAVLCAAVAGLLSGLALANGRPGPGARKVTADG